MVYSPVLGMRAAGLGAFMGTESGPTGDGGSGCSLVLGLLAAAGPAGLLSLSPMTIPIIGQGS